MNLTVSYSLNPPALLPSTSIPETPSSQTFTYSLDTSTPQTHLDSLEIALGKGRDDLNASLTVWKEAVNGLEGEKKGKKILEDGEEEEEEEE